MSETKHTPAPWWVKEGSREVWATVDGKDERIACVDGMGEQLWADLALIAGAPELLEVLADILNCAAFGAVPEHVWRRAIAVRAKVEGT